MRDIFNSGFICLSFSARIKLLLGWRKSKKKKIHFETHFHFFPHYVINLQLCEAIMKKSQSFATKLNIIPSEKTETIKKCFETKLSVSHCLLFPPFCFQYRAHSASELVNVLSRSIEAFLQWSTCLARKPEPSVSTCAHILDLEAGQQGLHLTNKHYQGLIISQTLHVCSNSGMQ